MSQPPLEPLMSAYAGGDRKAFSVLFQALGPRMQAFFLRSFRDPEKAKDLVQQVFLRIHAAKASYTEGAPVAPWVFTIAANLRRDEWRRMLRRPEELDENALELAIEQRSQDEAEDLSPEVASRVRAAVDRLPESLRMVVHLHRFEDMSFAEVAKVLSISEGAARVRASRAYDKLRETLERQDA